MNNSKFGPTKVLDLSKIEIKPKDLKYNYTKWEIDDKNKTKHQKLIDLQEHYIYEFVQKYIDNWKNPKIKDEYVLDNDYHISLDAGKTNLNRDGDSKISDFMNSTKKDISIKITFYADDDSLLLENSNWYTMTNDQTLPDPPPDYLPVNPYHPIPDNNDDNGKLSVVSKPWFWIFSSNFGNHINRIIILQKKKGQKN